MIKELYINADNYYIKFRTNCEEAITYINDHIADFSKVTISFKFIEEHEYDYIVNYIDGPNNKYDVISDKEIEVEFMWNLNDKKSILPIIFRQVIELIRQKNNEFKLHASSIEKNGKVALFLAPSEGGKTTTAMAICQKYGYSFFANDASVVKFINNIPFMLRGDQEFKVRLNGLKEYSNQYFNDESSKFDDKKELWYNKSKIDPKDIDVNLATGSHKITHIFFVKLDVLVKGCVTNYYNSCNDVEKWFKPKMLLLQNINGTIMGSDLVPYGNDGNLLNIAIPSLDTKDMYLKRIEFVNNLFDSCEIYQLRGELEEILKFVNDKLKDNE